MTALQILNPNNADWYARLVWALFDLVSEESIKVKVWVIPISIKISQLEPLIIRLVGPRQE